MCPAEVTYLRVTTCAQRLALKRNHNDKKEATLKRSAEKTASDKEKAKKKLHGTEGGRVGTGADSRSLPAGELLCWEHGLTEFKKDGWLRDVTFRSVTQLRNALGPRFFAVMEPYYRLAGLFQHLPSQAPHVKPSVILTHLPSCKSSPKNGTDLKLKVDEYFTHCLKLLACEKEAGICLLPRAPFRTGEEVTWADSDEEIPEGTVGTVLHIIAEDSEEANVGGSGGFVQVQWPDCSYGHPRWFLRRSAPEQGDEGEGNSLD